MKKALLILFFVTAALQCFAQTNEVLIFVQGNDAYEKQQYGKAVEFYEQILQNGKMSGSLYYNLANAYFKQDNLGKAILNYERAKQLMPRDPELRANADYARSMVSDLPAGTKTISSFFIQPLKWLTLQELYWVLLFLIIVFAMTHLMSLYFSWRKSRKLFILIVLVVVIVYWIAGIVVKTHGLKNKAVMMDSASARFEPRQEATVHFNLGEGQIVTVIKNEESWVKVKRQDGKTGWLPADKAEAI